MRSLSRLAPSVLVSVLINITLIGASAVFLLLTSGLISSLTETFISISLCQWIPIVAAVLLIPLWLGSPAEFWPVAYSAMISTTVGSIFLIIDTIVEISNNGIATDFNFNGVESFATAFGTILFAFGGASAFPNFQNDMKEKEKFPKAVMFGFTGEFTMVVCEMLLSLCGLPLYRLTLALPSNRWSRLRGLWSSGEE